MPLDADVQRTIAENKGFVVILAGSGSDSEHIGKIAEALKGYDIPHQVRILSGHKESKELVHELEDYERTPGSLLYITVAGRTDALSGIVSWESVHPVVSCPPDSTPQFHNQSCLNNPPGSSNAYIADPKNAARFAAQVFSYLSGTLYQCKLFEENQKKKTALDKADIEIRKLWKKGVQ